MYTMWNTSHCPNIYPFVTQLAVQKYEEMFPAFSDSRECKLLKVGVPIAHIMLVVYGFDTGIGPTLVTHNGLQNQNTHTSTHIIKVLLKCSWCQFTDTLIYKIYFTEFK